MHTFTRKSLARAIAPICLLAAGLWPASNAAAAVLLVDFADGTNNVPSDAAGFVFANGSGSPQDRTYLSATQGYTDGSMDLGAGVGVQLQTFNRTTNAVNVATLRLVDRNNAAVDLINDWATVEPGVGSGQVPTVGVRINITGLITSKYNFTSLHRDTGNQVGVMDVQYSLDGGTSWINLGDNASYGNFDRTFSLSQVLVNSTYGLSLRYIAGGGLYGAAGQTTNTVASNRLMPLNSFEIESIPAPAALPAGLALLALLGLRRR